MSAKRRPPAKKGEPGTPSPPRNVPPAAPSPNGPFMVMGAMLPRRSANASPSSQLSALLTGDRDEDGRSQASTSSFPGSGLPAASRNNEGSGSIGTNDAAACGSAPSKTPPAASP